MVRRLGFVSISVAVAIVLTEVTLNLFFRIDDPYRLYKRVREGPRYIESQFFPNERFIFYPEPELSGMAAQTRFTTDNLGFRGSDIHMPKPPNEYRIFMVGGSTTECLYLDDTATVPARLQSTLNRRLPSETTYRVYNAGKGGDQTCDHVAMISQRSAHLQPDMMILLAGLNDLLAAMNKVDYLHLPERPGTTVSFLDMSKYFLTEFQIPRRLYHLLHRQSESEVMQEIPFHSSYNRQVALCNSHPVAAAGPRTDLSHYAENLRTIIGVAMAHKITLICVAQATTWNSTVDPGAAEWHWLLLQNGIRYSDRSMDAAMGAYNDVTRRLAREFNLPFLDLAQLLPKSREYIYDDCHFNIEGAEIVGAMLGEMLIRDNLLSRSDR